MGPGGVSSRGEHRLPHRLEGMGMRQSAATMSTFFASCELRNRELLEALFCRRSLCSRRDLLHRAKAAPPLGVIGVNKPHLTCWKIEAKSYFR